MAPEYGTIGAAERSYPEERPLIGAAAYARDTLTLLNERRRTILFVLAAALLAASSLPPDSLRRADRAPARLPEPGAASSAVAGASRGARGPRGKPPSPLFASRGARARRADSDDLGASSVAQGASMLGARVSRVACVSGRLRP